MNARLSLLGPLLGSLLATLLSGAVAFGQEATPAPETEAAQVSVLWRELPQASGEVVPLERDVSAGRALFREKCAVCHGREGDGQTPAGRHQWPRPRDFTKGLYKFRSTPSGSLPTEADLLERLRKGVPATAMPAWPGLTDDERLELARFLLTLARVPEGAVEPGPMRVLVIPPVPALDGAAVERGRLVYEQLGCAQCHGARGEGDGPQMEGLRDEDGEKLPPSSLLFPQRFGGGRRPEDLYRTLATGLDGTAMPAYGEAVAPESLWDLIAFVLSLSRS